MMGDVGIGPRIATEDWHRCRRVPPSAAQHHLLAPVSVAGGLQGGCHRRSETGARYTKSLHLRLKRVVAHTGFEPVLPP